MSMGARYVLSLVLAMGATDVALAFLRQNDISLYFTANVISFLVITLLFVHLSPRVRAALNTIGLVFFAAFIAIVAFKVVDILATR